MGGEVFASAPGEEEESGVVEDEEARFSLSRDHPRKGFLGEIFYVEFLKPRQTRGLRRRRSSGSGLREEACVYGSGRAR